MPGFTERNGVETPPSIDSQVAVNTNDSTLLDFAWRVITLVVVVAVAYVLCKGVHFLLLAFAGMLFGVFLSTVGQWLSTRTGISFKWSLSIVVFVLFCLTGALVYFLADRLIVQAAEMTVKIPQALQQGRRYLESYQWGQALLDRLVPTMESIGGSANISEVTNVLSGVADTIVAFVVILFVGIFGAFEPQVYKRGLLHLVPFRRRHRVDQALDAVALNLRHWLVGQFVLMAVMAATSALGLWIIGVPMALLLGVVTGVFEIVPYLGAWLSAILAGLLALLVGPWCLAMTMALYLALHILEGYIMVPLIQKRSVHLPPALTVITQLILGYVLGIMGVVVAAPLTVSAIVFIKMFYIQDTLGDQSVAAATPPHDAGDRMTAERPRHEPSQR